MRFENIADDPHLRDAVAPKGSPEWAASCRRRLQEAVNKEASGTISFASEFSEFLARDGWALLTTQSGKPFASFRAFALAPRPHGLGCSKERLEWLVKAAKKTVEEIPPALPHGANQHTAGRDNITSSERGTSAEYRISVLKRDRPDVATKLEAGEFKSVAEAWRAAGLERPHDPVAAVIRSLLKLTPTQLGEVEAWIASRLPAPPATSKRRGVK